MDVLELPRPVINFLRTMAKEGCRYVLSWDIFGGTDAVTLTLTWKLNDEQSQLAILKSPPQQRGYDEIHIQQNDSLSSTPRRSRRDEHPPISSIFRSTRGKSLEENHRVPVKYIPQQQSQILSLERTCNHNRHKKESDPIYANIPHIKPSINSTSMNNKPSLPCTHTYHQQTRQQCESPILRKINSATPVTNDTSTKLKDKTVMTNRKDHGHDEDDDTLDPWVKRFEYSLNVEQDDDDDYDNDRTEVTSGKVKFKRKPDYF